MNTPRLLASLAVAATVSADDLKDPAEVAQDWNRSTASTAPALTDDLSLRAQTVPAPPAVAAPPDISNLFPGTRARPPRSIPRPREPLIDAPGYRIPDVLPDNMPPGTKAWEYGGQTYWLLPLIPSRGK